MLETESENRLLVAEVVASLSGHSPGEPEVEGLMIQVERAATEFDGPTAEAFARALLDFLTEEPSSLKELEALITLGLAHPKVLTKFRIPLAQEGRRLAVLLENEGAMDHAQSLLEVLASRFPEDRSIDKDLAAFMRRSGNGDLLIERYLALAEECVQAGKPLEAVPWLQEILLLDRNRRDVARMIRDLRWEEAQRIATRRRRVTTLTVALAVSMLLSLFGWREWTLASQLDSLPTVSHDDSAGLRESLAQVDALISENPLWMGAFRASRQRLELRAQVDRIDAVEESRHRARIQEAARKLDIAENARVAGRDASADREFVTALGHFERSLDIAPDDWEHRPRVQADIDAIRTWLKDDSR